MSARFRGGILRRSAPGFYVLLGLFYIKNKIPTIDMAFMKHSTEPIRPGDEEREIIPVTTTLLAPKAQAPRRKHVNSAGYVVFCPETVTIKPHKTDNICLEFCLDYPPGYFALVKDLFHIVNRGLMVVGGVNEACKNIFLFLILSLFCVNSHCV